MWPCRPLGTASFVADLSLLIYTLADVDVPIAMLASWPYGCSDLGQVAIWLWPCRVLGAVSFLANLNLLAYTLTDADVAKGILPRSFITRK